jgi:hypothetical protein
VPNPPKHSATSPARCRSLSGAPSATTSSKNQRNRATKPRLLRRRKFFGGGEGVATQRGEPLASRRRQKSPGLAARPCPVPVRSPRLTICNRVLGPASACDRSPFHLEPVPCVHCASRALDLTRAGGVPMPPWPRPRSPTPRSSADTALCGLFHANMSGRSCHVGFRLLLRRCLSGVSLGCCRGTVTTIRGGGVGCLTRCGGCGRGRRCGRIRLGSVRCRRMLRWRCSR